MLIRRGAREDSKGQGKIKSSRREKERKNNQLIPPAGESRRGAVGVCAGGKILLAVGWAVGLSARGRPGVS